MQDVTVFFATIRRVRQDWAWSTRMTPVRQRPHQVLWGPRRGAATVHLHDRDVILEAGRLIHVRMNQVRGIRRRQAGPLIMQWCSFHQPGAEQLPMLPTITDSMFVDACFTRLTQTYRSHGGRHADCAIWMQALLAALRIDSRSDSVGLQTGSLGKLQRCCQQIDADPGADWRIESLADSCGWSRKHFSRLFRQSFGTSPRAYLTRSRIEAACEMLRMSDASLADIAASLGFHDAYHFSRQFRQQMGMAPGVWRRTW
ncbi:MAG: helix-turn-helix transcriptional regulator [Planctomycetota bacterium]